jgi:hypothetical protein
MACLILFFEFQTLTVPIKQRRTTGTALSIILSSLLCGVSPFVFLATEARSAILSMSMISWTSCYAPSRHLPVITKSLILADENPISLRATAEAIALAAGGTPVILEPLAAGLSSCRNWGLCKLQRQARALHRPCPSNLIRGRTSARNRGLPGTN